MDKIPYHTTARVKSLKAAADDWVKATGIAWDVAACWHLPIGEMAADVEHAQMAVGTKLRRYFNQLDRRTFKAKHKQGFRIKRFITLEHAKSVGWHVHGVLATPEHVSQQQLIEDIKQIWRDFVQYDDIGLPQSCLAWCEPITSRYPQYTTKHSFGPLQNAKGAIDIQNTYFGELPN